MLRCGFCRSCFLGRWWGYGVFCCFAFAESETQQQGKHNGQKGDGAPHIALVIGTRVIHVYAKMDGYIIRNVYARERQTSEYTIAVIFFACSGSAQASLNVYHIRNRKLCLPVVVGAFHPVKGVGLGLDGTPQTVMKAQVDADARMEVVAHASAKCSIGASF